MSRPRLLDLFAGAGGATKGYRRAGFYVVGVDNRPQPHYCGDEFYQADALDFLQQGFDMLHFDAVHASPPCQAYVRSGNLAKDGRHPRLVEPVRELLRAAGVPWVIENVPGAPLRADLVLCGSMFGLAIRRHRWFEASWPLPPWTLSCRHDLAITGVYGHPHGEGGAWPSGRRPMLPGNLATWSREMGIDWMNTAELAEAIPPAYTEFVGAQLLQHLQAPA